VGGLCSEGAAKGGLYANYVAGHGSTTGPLSLTDGRYARFGSLSGNGTEAGSLSATRSLSVTSYGASGT
jgi:hypothetical protein